MTIKTLARRALLTTAAVAAFGAAPLASAASYTNIFNFGDSLSDTGNIAQVTGFPLPPYTSGRFTSNFTDGTPGVVWFDVVASQLGFGSTNSLAGGNNYAWGGARTGPVNAGLPPSLIDQANFYLQDTGGVADPTALYSVFGGGNDVRDNDIADSVANISSIITALHSAGAMNFFVPNLPDIGLTPESLADEAPGGPGSVISAASMQFNDDLRIELKNLEDTLGVNIIEFDLFAIFNNILADPGAFGFSNVTEPCYTGGLDGTGGTLCADPDSYLFFDGIHPTAAAHQLLGNLAVKEILEAGKIPVPAALPLFLSALAMFGFARRRAA